MIPPSPQALSHPDLINCLPETCHITLEASSRDPYNIGLVIFSIFDIIYLNHYNFVVAQLLVSTNRAFSKNEFSEKEFFIKKGILNQNLAQTSDDSVQPCSQLKI